MLPTSVQTRSIRIAALTASLTVGLGLAGAGAALLSPRAAIAEAASPSGVITTTLNADCAALSGVFPHSTLTQTVLTAPTGGGVRLAATLDDYFAAQPDGPVDAGRWLAVRRFDYGGAATPVVSGGWVALNGAYLRSQAVFSQPVRFLEAKVQLNATVPITITGLGKLGFDTRANDTDPIVAPYSLRLFTTPDFIDAYDRLRTLSLEGSLDPSPDNYAQELLPSPDLSAFHIYRLEWDEAATRYFLDGALQRVVAAGAAPPAYAWLSTFLPGKQILVEWVRAGAYPAQGALEACAQDAGQPANWQLAYTATVPAATSLAFQARTSADGLAWSEWSAPFTDSGGQVPGASGRYLQFRVVFTSTSPLASPELQAVTLSYFHPAAVQVDPGLVTVQTAASQAFSARVVDAAGQAFTGLSVTWAADPAVGSIDGAGWLTVTAAPASATIYTDAVTASAGLVSGAATVIVDSGALSLSAGSFYAGAQGAPLTLTAEPNNLPVGCTPVYTWDFGDGQTGGPTTAVSLAHTYLAPGSYTATVAAAGTGCGTASASATVTVDNVPPTARLAGPATALLGQPVRFDGTASSDPGGALYYAWDLDGSGHFADGSGPLANGTFATAGAHIVRLRVDDGDGAQNVAAASVTVRYGVFLPLADR